MGFPPHIVPNVPCGVESSLDSNSSGTEDMFLMYRVELKACPINVSYTPGGGFLMYRVELKVGASVGVNYFDFEKSS